MTWSDEFSVGVPLIDAQHQALFNGIERIYNILSDHDAARDRRVTGDALFFLEQHAIRHFEDEEAYMRSIHDGGYLRHKAQHEAILQVLAAQKAEIAESDFSPRTIRKLLGTMLSWLTYHTLEVDRLIGKAPVMADHADSAGAALEKAITQVMTDMLHITPALVDSSYTGAYFGNELFCLVSGLTEAQETLHILYAANTQVIQQSVGRLLGLPVTQTDELVISAFEEICRVLSLHFVKFFRNNSFFNISSSAILEQEALTDALPTLPPICSMLFDEAYGSFIIRIWKS